MMMRLGFVAFFSSQAVAFRPIFATSRKLSRVARGSATTDVFGDGGVVKLVAKEGSDEKLTDGSVIVVRYRGSVGKGGDAITFTSADSAIMTIGDGTMIPGWDAALRTMAVGESAAFSVAAQYAYGNAGVPPVIPPGAALDFEVDVLDLKGNIITDTTFADSAPLTPRTPSAIKAEFERRQSLKDEKKEGLEGALEWVKSIYIFGFFDAPKGGQLPWYLRPIITFPAMFGIVGVAFSVVVTSGAVTMERKAATPDDMLDLLSFLGDAVTAASGFSA
mmetsp:Transcript_59132/g.118699  ORF Transcript_59132/g.118699 Transcript_59132/m.118699 type:complete len:276 (+) Transcript_59132:93-920(+)